MTLRALLEEVSRERDEDRDFFLDARRAAKAAIELVVAARRELWWFIEGVGDIDREEAAAKAIHIQDDFLAPALAGFQQAGVITPLPAPGMTDLMVAPESIDAFLAANPPPESSGT